MAVNKEYLIMIHFFQKKFSALASKISIRVRIAGFFMVLGILILSIFSGTVLFFFHQSWEAEEKEEIRSAWHDLQNKEFDDEIFSQDAPDIFLKKFNISQKPVFISRNAPKIDPHFLFTKKTDEFFFAQDDHYVGLRKELSDSHETLFLLKSLSDHKKQEHLLLAISLFLIAGLSVFLFGMGYWFAFSLLSSLRKISHDSKKISLTNLSHRLPIEGPKNDEIRILSENLNDMFARIERSSLVLKQFTQDASHELKTPLAIIDTSLQLAIKTGNMKKVEESREELKNLETLLDSLLVLAEHEEKIFLESEKSEVFLKAEIDKTLQKIAPHFTEKNISVSFSQISDHAKIWAEKESLLRILWNLLWNAFKFCPPKGTIAVKFSGKILEISNTGSISKKNIPHIFTRFFRGDASKSSDGTGIGLALVKTFVEANGGKISVSSSDNTVTFQVRFV